MKIITKKKINRFALFLVISGLGALWLTYWWFQMSLGDDFIGSRGEFGSFSVLFYYIFNSFLLFLLGIILYAKYFKIYSVLSVILGISVTTSLFIFESNTTDFLLSNLFGHTIYFGILAGIVFGGPLLIPMFLFGVYISAVRGIQHIRGKLNYSVSEEII